MNAMLAWLDAVLFMKMIKLNKIIGHTISHTQADQKMIFLNEKTLIWFSVMLHPWKYMDV